MSAPVVVPKPVRAGIERVRPLLQNPYDLKEVRLVASDQGVEEIVDWIRDNPVLYASGLLHGFATEGA